MHIIPAPREKIRGRRKMVIRKPLPVAWRVGISIASVVIGLLVYEMISRQQTAANARQTMVPSLLHIAEGFITISKPDLFGDIWILKDLSATFYRMAIGFSIGVIISTVIGILMGCLSFVEAIFKPWFAFGAKIPPPAMLPMLWVFMKGVSDTLFITLIILGVVLYLTQSVYKMVKFDVPQELIDKGYTLGASTSEQMWTIIFPIILPRIIEELRLQYLLSMIFLIGAENYLADSGFGYRMRMRMKVFDMAVITDYLILLFAAGYLADYAITFARKKLSPWFGEE